MGRKLYIVGIVSRRACGSLPFPIARDMFIFRRSLGSKNSLVQRRRPSVLVSVCDLVSATKPFVGFHGIRSRISLQKVVQLARIS
jgi:hypothetical protein